MNVVNNPENNGTRLTPGSVGDYLSALNESVCWYNAAIQLEEQGYLLLNPRKMREYMDMANQCGEYAMSIPGADTIKIMGQTRHLDLTVEGIRNIIAERSIQQGVDCSAFLDMPLSEFIKSCILEKKEDACTVQATTGNPVEIEPTKNDNYPSAIEPAATARKSTKRKVSPKAEAAVRQAIKELPTGATADDIAKRSQLSRSTVLASKAWKNRLKQTPTIGNRVTGEPSVENDEINLIESRDAAETFTRRMLGSKSLHSTNRARLRRILESPSAADEKERLLILLSTTDLQCPEGLEGLSEVEGKRAIEAAINEVSNG